jgi:uracil-DNA glycosylase family 4
MTDEDLKQIRVANFASMGESARSCTACSLSRTRTKVVFGVGNPNSPLLLVGEGPGANEDAIGEPFVGRAGKLLDECLYNAGMKRSHVYITNIVKCRASIIEAGRIKNRVPTSDEIGTCIPLWLEKQIAAMSPLVILCIGSPAANALIHKDFKIMQERGKFMQGKCCRYSIAALHPAYILRQEGESYLNAKKSLIDDLRSAKEKAVQAKSEPKLSMF